MQDDNRGFTLVELAIVIIISGLVAVVLFAALQYQAQQNQRQTTLDNLANLQAALSEFKGVEGRYPCPAPVDASLNSTTYALEGGLPGSCVSAGVTLTTTGTFDADGNGTPDQVAIGMVPYKAIVPFITYVNLIGSNVFDGWNNRILYAVSVTQTNATTFDDSHGAIRIVDENNDTLITNPSTGAPAGAHFVLVSFGEDGRGAYSREGQLVMACGTSTSHTVPPPPSTGLSEIENCNGDGVFMSGLRNLSDLNYNDDIVKFTSVQRSDLWTVTGELGTIPQVTNTNIGNVGIGVDSLPNMQRLSLLGTFAPGRLYTPTLCDTGGVNCMPPATIGGNMSNMTCSTGQVITAIQGNAVSCAPAFTGPPAKTCPAGQFMVGISNLNNAKCWNPGTGAINIY